MKPLPLWQRGLYIGIGLLLVTIGFIAIFIPGIPTTPFLLLASYFFVRSSTRLYNWLLRSRFFGPILSDWHTHRAIRKRIKWRALSVVALFLAIGMYFTIPRLHWYINAIILALALFGVLMILRLPVVDEKK